MIHFFATLDRLLAASWCENAQRRVRMAAAFYDSRRRVGEAVSKVDIISDGTDQALREGSHLVGHKTCQPNSDGNAGARAARSAAAIKRNTFDFHRLCGVSPSNQDNRLQLGSTPEN